MQLKLLKCDWGMEHLGPMPDRLRAFAKAGYDGVECASIGMEPDEFGDLTKELGLDYVAMMFCDDEKLSSKQLESVKNPANSRQPPPGRLFRSAAKRHLFNKVMEQASSMTHKCLKRTARGVLLTMANRTHSECVAVAADHCRLQPFHERRREQPEAAAVFRHDGRRHRSRGPHSRAGRQCPFTTSAGSSCWRRLTLDRIFRALVGPHH